MKRSFVYPEIRSFIRFGVERRIFLFALPLKINQLNNILGSSVNVTFKDEPSNRRILCVQRDGNFTGVPREL